VSFPEFLQMMAPNEDDHQNDIMDALRLFDPNNHGFIDLREIEKILFRFGNNGDTPSPQEAQEINAMILDLRQAATWSADTFVVRTEDALSLLLGHQEPSEEKSSPNFT